ncbi:accessory Sec-dependent serine-rich glycoprotein adhesin, partial [Streptococcus suis]|uniref:accessory Sec-dependent serine-rich glycoprotein adhesin n=4 Tax=Streptococcus suis TaxID=1307 RepID=UPI0004A428D8
MKHKRFNKDFDEVGRKSRVKMHKSGKNWIRTVMSQLSLLRVIRGKGQETVSVPLVDSSERLESQRYQYLKAILTSGAVVTGAAVMTSAFGEEQVAAVEQQLEETTDTLIDKDHVVVETASTSEGVDYTNLDNALASLNQALSSPIIDASTNTVISTITDTSQMTINTSTAEGLTATTSYTPSFTESTGFLAINTDMVIFKGTSIQTEDGRNAVSPVAALNPNGFSSIRLYRTGANGLEEETDSGFKLDQSTGLLTGVFSGTISVTYNEVGVYSRSLIYTDSASGGAYPPVEFKIRVIDTTVNNSLTNRLHKHIPSKEEVLNAVTVLTGGESVYYDMKVMSHIPATDGTATVRIITEQGVYKDVQVPITYRPNQAPTVTVSEQSVDRSGKTVIDVSKDVTVMDAEDDRDPDDSLTTTITYTV